MKKVYSLLLAFVSLTMTAQAQTPISIAAARAMPLGTTVTVTGIVTNGSELGAPLRFLQDNTAGIAAYSGTSSIPPAGLSMSALNPGDSILITGQLKNYNNLLEIDPVTNLQRFATNRPLPAPVVFQAGTFSQAFAEQYEGQLVRLNGVTNITTTQGGTFATFSGNTTYRINNIPGQDLRINAASTGTDGIVGKPRPTGTFDIIGIMGQFQANYQIQPRLYSDFILGNAPNFTNAVTATNITTTGLTIAVQTQNAGTATVTYGLTSAMGQTATSTTSTTSHAVALTGLQPATVYYVQVTVTNANGTSTTAITPVITASASSGTIKAYFNRPVATAYALPNNQAIHLFQTLDDTVIAYINRAKYTVDIAIYSFGMTPFAQALNAARARGVNVRFIGDGSTTSSAIQALDAAIPRVLRNDNFIMHNKFLAIDANSPDPNDPIVITGSTNFTAGQINTDANNIVILQDQSLARVYTMEFNEMFGSSTMTPGTGTFGSNKSDNTPHQVMVGNRLVEVYFSPSDNVNTKLIETINSADHDLEFATMLITRSDIANAIRNRVMMGGTLNSCSGGLINDTIGASTPWFILKGAMGDRLEKFDGPGIMHHKYIMVDASAPASDPQVFVGSHNWSNSANNNNDENSLIIHDYYVVNQFYQEWAQRMLEENPAFSICNYALTGLETNPRVSSTLLVYPNPNQGEFFVQLNHTATSDLTIRVIDVTGRVVSNRTVSAANALQPVAVQTASIPAGLYTVQIMGEGVSATSRVVIQ